MSIGCVRWLLCRVACVGGPASRCLLYRESYNNNKAPSWRWPSSFSTSTSSYSNEEKKEKQQQQRSMGQKLPHGEVRVIGQAGENLGVLGQAEVLRLVEQTGLTLVNLNSNTHPPLYRLINSKQLDRRKNKPKDQARQEQPKEVNLSSDIAPHDLRTKMKQVQVLLEKKHHVRVTLRTRRGELTPALDSSLEQMIQQIEGTVGFVSKPAVIQAGKAAMCVLRSPTKKDLSKQTTGSQTTGSIGSETTSSQTTTSTSSQTTTSTGSQTIGSTGSQTTASSRDGPTDAVKD